MVAARKTDTGSAKPMRGSGPVRNLNTPWLAPSDEDPMPHGHQDITDADPGPNVI